MIFRLPSSVLIRVVVLVKMWKLLVATAIVLNIGEAQRSSYAPRPGSNSKLLPRFRKNETETELTVRGGQEDGGADTSSTLSPELQGTLEDHRLVHRVSQWPEDRQPFWFKNRNAISSMRDRDIDGTNLENQRPRPQFRSPFQGSARGRSRARAAAQRAEDDAYRDEDFFLGYPFYPHQRGRHHG